MIRGSFLVLGLLSVLMVYAEAQVEKPVPLPALFDVTTTEPPRKAATYLITFGETIRPGWPLTLVVNILKGENPVEISVMLTKDDETPLVQFPTQTVQAQASKQLTFKVPADMKRPYEERYRNDIKVHVSGKGKDVSFQQSEIVYFHEKSFSTFIQTDKAVYKPSQEVKMRAFFVQADLKIQPISKVDLIVKNPTGTRVIQQLGIVPKDGVVDYTFPLADDTSTGTWTILITDNNGNEETKTIEVDNYVSPRFEVTINVDKFFDLNAPYLDAEVFADYVFGQPVTDGDVLLSIQSTYGSYRENSAITRKGKLNKKGKHSVRFMRHELEEAVGGRGYYSMHLTITANVTEGNTFRKYSDEKRIQGVQSLLTIETLPITASNFKPGFKYTAYFEVKKKNGENLTPEEAKLIRIKLSGSYQVEKVKNETTTTPPRSDLVHSQAFPGFYYPEYESKKLEEETRTLDPEGRIVWDIDAPPDANSMDLTAKIENEAYTSAHKNVQKSQSPSKTFLKLSTLAVNPKIGDSVKIQADATRPVSKWNYLIFSQGKCIASGVHEPRTASTRFVFDFTITAEMAPTATMLVYYLADGYEVVVDALTFSVKGIFENKVTLEYNEATVKPGQTVDLKIKGEPGSRVFLLSVDKSVKLLKTGNDITMDLVLDHINSYNSNYRPWWRYMFICGWPGSILGSDAASTFRNANVRVMTDALVHEAKQDWYLRTTPLFTTTNAPTTSTGLSETGASKNEANADRENTASESVRKSFLESWIWNSLVLDDNGEAVLREDIPDTITTWITTAVAVNPQSGLSIPEEPAEVITFRDLFVSLDVPATLVRNEKYCFTASVHNYDKEPHSVTLNLPSSNDFNNIYIVENNDLLASEEEELEYAINFYIKETSIVSKRFCFRPKVIGDIEVKVECLTATPGLSDALIKKLSIKPEGVPSSTSHSHLIEFVNGQWTKTIPVEFPLNAVDGSQRIKIQTADNLMAPVIENLDDLLKMPYGCGEQNMINFAPDIAVARFLKKTNTSTEEIMDKVRLYLKKGYQKELLYEHGLTGGFSTFGANDNTKEPPSMLLTAFVFKCFCEAEELDREYGNILAVDENLLQRMYKWIASQQTKTDGNFLEKGKVFNAGLKGGLSSGLALTAYVFIALSKASKVLQTNEVQTSLDKALGYLERNLYNVTDEYDICIMTYALHLANSKFKDQAFDLMESKATIEDGKKYWKQKQSSHETLKRYYFSRSDALSIEMTSYCLLAHSARGSSIQEKIPIVKWLKYYAGPNGGFISTQDTVIGIEALTEVATDLYDEQETPFQLSVTYTTADGSRSQSVNVNKENQLLQQTMNIPFQNEKPTSLTLEARTTNGQDYKKGALTDVVFNYNVEMETDNQIYGLDVSTYETKLGIDLQIKAWTTNNEPASMTLIIVTIPEGYLPDLGSVEEMQEVMKVETRYGEDIVIYIGSEELTSDGLVMTLPLEATGNMVEAQTKSVIIFDYYQPDNRVVKNYGFSAFENKPSVCNKFGSIGICAVLKD